MAWEDVTEVIIMPDDDRARITLDDGVDEDGYPKTITRSLRVDPSASDVDVYNSVGHILSLGTKNLVKLERLKQGSMLEA